MLAAAPRSGVLELSRTMLVFVVSFSVPVAGMYVYRAVQGRRGTDLDAAFLSLGGAVWGIGRMRQVSPEVMALGGEPRIWSEVACRAACAALIGRF